MSVNHPIISVTGSSGAGTTSVKQTFEQIFRRESISAMFIEGDAFHAYDRAGMKEKMAEKLKDGDDHFSHFGPEANLLDELEGVFANYAESGSGRTRHYIHDQEEALAFGSEPGTFTEWEEFSAGSDLLFYEGLHG
ncbi:MAG: phosphoribulokinase, partial [Rhodospirillaceae bacterium]|nr:phosphoribulokinase [Rhodospirillaceae bacterium]